MTRTDVYNRIFEYPRVNVGRLALTDPAEVAKASKSKEAAGWELLLGSMRLRRAGQRSPANDWLNHAARASIDHDLFKAEMLGEAGQGLFDSDRLPDAVKILNSAAAIWRDVCARALDACKGGNQQAAAALALRLLPLFEGAKVSAPAAEAAVRSGAEAVPMIQQWLADRAVVGRANTASAFVRGLAKGGQVEDARRTLSEEMDWLARNFTSPERPVAAHPLEKRLMAPATRRSLYVLLLAAAEIDLAAGAFEKSADGFAAAAAIYENKVEDQSDINRLLRAKFNQANSLLRLKRIKEALDIYDLCEHGFNSIDEPASAQRVAQAKVFARSLEADDD